MRLVSDLLILSFAYFLPASAPFRSQRLPIPFTNAIRDAIPVESAGLDIFLR